MRSTLDIVCALKDEAPVTEEELRFAVLSLNAMNYFAEKSVTDLINAIEKGNQSLISYMCKAAKSSQVLRQTGSLVMDMLEYLGPENIPGTPEFKVRFNMVKNIFKAATGEEI